MSEPWNPSPPPPPPMNPPGGYMPPPPMVGGNAQQSVQGPAIGLIVTAGVNILCGIYLVVQYLLAGKDAVLAQASGAEEAEILGKIFGLIKGGGIFWGLLVILVAGFVLWAALRMKQLRGWNLALTASILAMVPCISCCFFVSIPLGIWALVLLMKPEVKAAFTA